MIDYSPLWHRLIDVKMTRTQLAKAVRMGSRSIAAMGRGEYISMANLEAICRYLDCTPNDILKFVQEEEFVQKEESE